MRRQTWRMLLAGVVFFLSSISIAWADGGVGSAVTGLDDEKSSPLLKGDGPNVILLMGKVLFYLILIIGIFYFIMKIVAQKNRRRLQGRAVNTLGGVPLGQNKSLQIVEIGRSVYLLGVGDNVQLVHKIDDPEEVADLIASMEAQSASPVAGMKQLSSWIGGLRKQDRPTVEEPAEDLVAHSFQEVFQSKMSNMASRKQLVEELLKNQKSTDRSSEE